MPNYVLSIFNAEISVRMWQCLIAKLELYFLTDKVMNNVVSDQSPHAIFFRTSLEIYSFAEMIY